MLRLDNYTFNKNQIVLKFGDYDLSIINDGYGGNRGMYEIGVFKDDDMVELPGVTAEGDTVKGFLTESEVDEILLKMYSITKADPERIR